MLKILVVEDETAIRRFIKINLERQGFDVVDVESGEEGLDAFLDFHPDIALLDVMLPGISGLDVAKRIRELDNNVGIIMLTAKSQDVDKILGLESGADDYMTKPFNPTELILRIKSLARRVETKDVPDTLEDDVFKLDQNTRQFFKNGVYVELTPTEFAIMDLFMRNPHKAFSRDELLDLIWGRDFVGDSKIIDVNIRRIRSKIEDDASEPEYINTVWGLGYRYR
ncbi:DNA-binding response OmpR family regulator [Ezakiella coagulans]|uniref:DNA-binding response OmpR family regulator n=1 Tax=Ezakiella coagulans TaxID=46507 RepID=A0A2U1E2S3_9FIRM|nr:response regulator transcription factor [Ezakiella coagulans]KGF07310.1 chemotaxis protein CheY [Tissierellia bacterium S7-1-4]PVY94132.1 DNA-binding response OmpR family regulator [Ezakiella coagulans]UQK60771.1 response regulator transcription factor [Ezakiella coagulans]